MDLSAVIFVVLALAWAAYLIPKALAHHDEMASDRLVEGHSERVRILRRRSTPIETVEVEVEDVTTSTAPAAPVTPAVAAEPRARRRERPILTPAGRAARRRRRVLAVLLLATIATAVLGYLAYVPLWTVAVPVALVLAFLVIARRSVRSAQRSSLAQRRPARSEQRVEPAAATTAAESRDEVDVDLHEVQELQESEPDVLADDGALWDPLPLTVPTYVNKARARRTVRTIELTGMQSSGHDESDSALAREASAESPSGPAADAPRRVAGA